MSKSGKWNAYMDGRVLGLKLIFQGLRGVGDWLMNVKIHLKPVHVVKLFLPTPKFNTANFKFSYIPTQQFLHHKKNIPANL